MMRISKTNNNKSVKPIYRLVILNACLLLFCGQLAFVNASELPRIYEKPERRFFVGIYFPSLTNLVSRADFQIALNLWMEDFSQIMQLAPVKVQLFDSINEIKNAINNDELDFVMAPPILLAKHIERGKLADGLVGTSINGGDYGTVLLARNDKNIHTLNDLSGKRLLLPEYDELAPIYIDSLSIKTFKKHYQQVVAKTATKERQSAVILALFFDQADIGITEKEIYQVMVELNPQIHTKLKILTLFPTKSPNYGYFSSRYPQELRKRLIQKILELNQQPRTQQILNDLRMSSLVECDIEELQPFDKLIEEYESLKKSLPP